MDEIIARLLADTSADPIVTTVMSPRFPRPGLIVRSLRQIKQHRPDSMIVTRDIDRILRDVAIDAGLSTLIIPLQKSQDKKTLLKQLHGLLAQSEGLLAFWDIPERGVSDVIGFARKRRVEAEIILGRGLEFKKAGLCND